MSPCIGRRQFVALFSSAVASWPLAARAQQPAMPVIGYFTSGTPEGFSDFLRALRQGLKESGYVEGENLAIEYRWAENEPERLSMLAADLVRRQVKVIAAMGPPASMAAARATTTIPIVFGVPEDPVRLGLVASLARPGGNATGVNFFSAELAAKRLELLHELVPTAKRVAVLLNPAEPTIAAATLRDVEGLRAPRHYKSAFSTPAPSSKSILPSRRWRTSGLTPCSSAAALSLSTGASRSRTWRHGTLSPRSLASVSTPKPAGW